MPRGLNPLTALAYLAWSTALIYSGYYLEPLVPAAPLLALSGMAPKLVPLYAWILAPPFLIVWALQGLEAAAETVIALGSIALAYSAGLSSIDPRGLPWIASRLGLGSTTGLVPLMVYRALDYIYLAVSEARNSLAGRGVRGRLRILLVLPIPLVVHSFNLSGYMAEALYFKRSGRYPYKPGITAWDLIVAYYLVLATAHVALAAHR